MDPTTIFTLAVETIKFAFWLADRFGREQPSCSIVRQMDGKPALFYITRRESQSRQKGRCMYTKYRENKVLLALAACGGRKAELHEIGILERGSWSDEKEHCVEKPDYDVDWDALELITEFNAEEEIARLELD